jgi:multidrug efflux pump subunit AcrB
MTSGGSVPLKAVAEIRFGAGPTTVQRTNQVRRTSVGADLAPGWSRATPGRRSTSCRP